VDVGVEFGGGFGGPFVSPLVAGGLADFLLVVAASAGVAACSSLISGDCGMSPAGTVTGGVWVGVGESVRPMVASARFCARNALRVVSITTRNLDSCVHITTCSRIVDAIAWYFL
jgi:hypothetical protein